MKIRNGYVSNSSSSSFCILGFIIDEENLPEKIQEKFDKSDHDYEILDIIWDYNNEHLTNKLKLIDVVEGIYKYYDCHLIGVKPELMKDGQTLLQFKEDVLKEIHQLGFENITINDLKWHIDGGYDG